MTPDDPPAGPARRSSDAPLVPSGRRQHVSRAAPAALERPDGGWQVGVGPGAVVLRLGAEGPAGKTGEVLGPALAGLSVADQDAPATRGAERPACAVVGAGPLASRLRRTLGEVSPDSSEGVQLLVHQHVVPPHVGVAVARSARATVPVVAQSRRILVGPVVGVGSGPCLHCLDLHRRDRDPAWPALATGLGHPAEQVVPLDLPEPLARAAEGLVLLLLSSVLAGRPVSAGLAYELGPVAPHVVARRWTTHPACPWHR